MSKDLTHAIQIARNAAMNWAHDKLQAWAPPKEYATGDLPDAIVLALSRSGLLATPAMRQAVEACKRYMVNNPHGTAYMAEASALCFKAGAACLAEEAERAPKPRWTVAPHFRGDERDWMVIERAPEGDMQRTGPLTESQARAVADALNREGVGRG